MIVAIEAPHYCAGLEVIDGRVGAWCAPIIGWARGKPWAEVRAYFVRKGYKVIERSIMERINAARSHTELDGLIPEILLLDEPERARLRIPFRAARELFHRMAQAPLVSPHGVSTFHDQPKPRLGE